MKRNTLLYVYTAVYIILLILMTACEPHPEVWDEHVLDGVWVAQEASYTLWDSSSNRPKRYNEHFDSNDNIWAFSVDQHRIYDYQDSLQSDIYTTYSVSESAGRRWLVVDYGREQAIWYITKVQEQTLTLQSSISIDLSSDTTVVSSKRRRYELQTTLYFNKKP